MQKYMLYSNKFINKNILFYNNCFTHSANSLSFVLTTKHSDNSIICLILQCLNST